MKFLIREKLSPHKYKTPEGYLICQDAILARTGKQSYRKNELFADAEDGDAEIDVDRPYDEVFAPETLASFENKPVTVEHPDEDVNSENYKSYSVGFARDIRQAKTENGEDVIIGNLVIQDADTIEEILNGEHCELSCGYDCDIKDDKNGYRQTHIRGNHIALCEKGRAGIAKIVDSVKTKDEGMKTVRITSNDVPPSQERYIESIFNHWNCKYKETSRFPSSERPDKDFVAYEVTGKESNIKGLLQNLNITWKDSVKDDGRDVVYRGIKIHFFITPDKQQLYEVQYNNNRADWPEYRYLENAKRYVDLFLEKGEKVANASWFEDSVKDSSTFYIIENKYRDVHICKDLDEAHRYKNSNGIYSNGFIYEVNAKKEFYEQIERTFGQGDVRSELYDDIKKGKAKLIDSVKDKLDIIIAKVKIPKSEKLDDVYKRASSYHVSPRCKEENDINREFIISGERPYVESFLNSLIRDKLINGAWIKDSVKDSIKTQPDNKKLGWIQTKAWDSRYDTVEELIEDASHYKPWSQNDKKFIEEVIEEVFGVNRTLDSVRDADYPIWLPKLIQEAKTTNKDELIDFIYSKTGGYGRNQISWWVEAYQKNNAKDSVKDEDTKAKAQNIANKIESICKKHFNSSYPDGNKIKSELSSISGLKFVPKTWVKYNEFNLQIELWLNDYEYISGEIGYYDIGGPTKYCNIGLYIANRKYSTAGARKDVQLIKMSDSVKDEGFNFNVSRKSTNNEYASEINEIYSKLVEKRKALQNKVREIWSQTNGHPQKSSEYTDTHTKLEKLNKLIDNLDEVKYDENPSRIKAALASAKSYRDAAINHEYKKGDLKIGQKIKYNQRITPILDLEWDDEYGYDVLIAKENGEKIWIGTNFKLADSVKDSKKVFSRVINGQTHYVEATDIKDAVKKFADWQKLNIRNYSYPQFREIFTFDGKLDFNWNDIFSRILDAGYEYDAAKKLTNELFAKYKGGEKLIKALYETLKKGVKDSKKDALGHYFRLDKKKNDYDEFVVKEYVNGKFREEGSYHTDDWEDAVGTIKSIAKSMKMNIRQQGSSFIADSKKK